MRGRLALTALALACAAGAACSLFVDLSGLSATPEAGAPEAGADAPPPDGATPDADAGTPDTGFDAGPSCPDEAGSKMVDIGAGRCVDKLETSTQEYLAFLAAQDGGLAPMPPECAFKTSHVPQQVAGNTALPVAWTDWCDAWAYCSFIGKELCGSPDGGAAAAADFADATKSLWMAACSRDGQVQYPYGNTFDPTACRLTDDAGVNMGTAPSGSTPKCEGGFAGLFDMVGNIREWENACNGDAGAADTCRRRGAAFNEPDEPTRDCKYDEVYARNFRSESSGFRCCARAR